MKIQRNYSKEDVLNHSRIGFEFEFYTALDIKEVARSMSKTLGKRVVIPLDVPPVGLKNKPIYHSGVIPTDELFKLEADFSGGKDMRELITGPLNYKDAKEVLYGVLKWIKEFGYTNEKCSVHANISFRDNFKLNSQITKLDILKFIINFDEEFVYNRFPTRRNSVYARSINLIVPNNFFFYGQIPMDGSTQNIFITPDEKYFGVNFTKMPQNYLEFRYIGGKDYEDKYTKIEECVNHYIISLYKSLNFVDYSWKESDKVKKMVDEHKKLISVFNNYELFKKEYPGINVTVDMNNQVQNIKAHWDMIKNDIFGLIVRNKIRDANYNYDKDTASRQLYETKLYNALLENYDLVYCDIEGVLNECDLYYCTVEHSRVRESHAIRNNTFKNCKLENVKLAVGNEAEDCFIKNDKNHPIDCEVRGGVIRSGEIGKSADLDNKVLVVKEDSKDKFKTNDQDWIKLHKKFNRINYDTLRTYNGN